jgi:hypothetical protein
MPEQNLFIRADRLDGQHLSSGSSGGRRRDSPDRKPSVSLLEDAETENRHLTPLFNVTVFIRFPLPIQNHIASRLFYTHLSSRPGRGDC